MIERECVYVCEGEFGEREKEREVEREREAK